MVERVKKNSRVAVVWSSVEGLVTLVWRGVQRDARCTGRGQALGSCSWAAGGLGWEVKEKVKYRKDPSCLTRVEPSLESLRVSTFP